MTTAFKTAFIRRAFVRAAVLLAPVSLLQPGASGQNILTANRVQTAVCSFAACSQPPKPVIKAVDSASVISPSGKVVLDGVNFNSADGTPGQIVLTIGVMRGVSMIRLGATGFRQPYMQVQLTVLNWADGAVFGQIPNNITGVIDGTVTLAVWRSDGVKSDPVSVKFIAARDLVVLPMSDVTVKSCSAKADANLCNHQSDSAQLSIPTTLSPLPTLYGTHVEFLKPLNAVPGLQDTFTFSLQNGWVLDNSYQFENGYAYSAACAGDFADENLNAPPPGTSGQVVMSTNVSCGPQYKVSLHITGPKGVPWK
jgi:hypothetical protein